MTGDRNGAESPLPREGLAILLAAAACHAAGVHRRRFGAFAGPRVAAPRSCAAHELWARSGAHAEPFQSDQTLLALLERWGDVAISAVYWHDGEVVLVSEVQVAGCRSSAALSALGCGHGRVRHRQPASAVSATNRVTNSIGDLMNNNMATWLSGDGGRGQKLPNTSAGATSESSSQHKRQVSQNPFTPAQDDFMTAVLQDTFATLGAHLSKGFDEIQARRQQHAGAIGAMEHDAGAHDVAICSMHSAIDELRADRDASRASAAS